MPKFSEKCEITDLMIGTHSFRVCTLKPDEFDNLKNRLVEIVPDQYNNPKFIADILIKSGKHKAANTVLICIPEKKTLRSGDLGEILAIKYIEECTKYDVPIYKLRFRDHRNMPMRGEDSIGIFIDEQKTMYILKVEAKSNIRLTSKVLKKAREELDSNKGYPTPHALTFIASRLWDNGNFKLSMDIITLRDNKRPNLAQVEHLLFTFTESNPASLQKKALEAYSGKIKQNSVGFRVTRHQELIATVYQGVIDDSNQ